MVLDQAMLRLLLNYDPETGSFTRIASFSRTGRLVPDMGSSKAGDHVGSRSAAGYLTTRIRGKSYYLHRLAWLYVHGEWPEVIDHINGDPGDNRIANLRDVSKAANAQNLHRASSASTTGIIGAGQATREGKFRATIKLDGRQRHLGYFATAEEAGAAYVAAKRSLHPHGTL